MRCNPLLVRRPGGGFDQVAPAEPGEPASSAGPVKPSRRRRSLRPHRAALRRVIEHDAEAGRFVTFAHSRRARDTIADMPRWHPSWPPRRQR
jgi:hypothetical protein